MDVLFGRGREHPDQFIGPGGVAVLKRPVAVGFHPLAIDVVLINPGHGCGGHTVSSFAFAIRPEVSEPTEVRSLRGTINLADGPAGVNEPAAEGEISKSDCAFGWRRLPRAQYGGWHRRRRSARRREPCNARTEA